MRWQMLGSVVAAAASVALGIGRDSGAVGAPSAPPRLNVVVIVADDERLDENSGMRNVQRLLARHGVSFAQYVATTPECAPSRATILTGRSPDHTGVTANFGPHGYASFDERSTLATWLHDAGYTTALVGKYLNDYTLDGDHRIPPGWDRWVALDSVPEERYYRYTLDENGREVYYGRRPKDYSTTVLTRKAVGFLRSARGPFFLYFAPVAPHLPAIPAPIDRGSIGRLPPLRSPAFDEADISDKPWHARFERSFTEGGIDYELNEVRRRQLETLRSLDRSVGEIVRALRRRGQLDRTLIVYVSDNGFLWGEHRLGGKIWPYEESIHLPLVVRTPWQAGDGTVDPHLVLNTDLAPTIAALAGVHPGLAEDGRSLLPLLHGRSGGHWRTSGLVEYRGPGQLRRGGPPPFRAVRTRRFLYVAYDNGWRELYDLRRDPWELRNLAGERRYAATELSLARRLVRLAGLPRLTAIRLTEVRAAVSAGSSPRDRGRSGR
ncbi:MAG TPA: sulfatase [Gaiella sp.]|nr:sulfatase [Gaiella sp.]